MPFKGKKLPDEAIAKIAEWIKAGALYDTPVADHDGVSREEALKHWAFRSPVRSPLPKVSDKRWSQNPIDAFIAEQLTRIGLTPLPEADQRTQIRRVYLDLIGLPPTVEETKQFLADKEPRAYEKVVDQLLASPQYGERWGRHWLDIWRYSDWYGWRDAESGSVFAAAHLALARLDGRVAEPEQAVRPDDRRDARRRRGRSWRPRRSARDRIPGTQLVHVQPECVAAGYGGLYFGGVPGTDDEMRPMPYHKYDPIPQTDYYSFRAFFEPHEVRTDRVPGQADIDESRVWRESMMQTRRSRPIASFAAMRTIRIRRVALQPGVPQLFGKGGSEDRACFASGRSVLPGWPLVRPGRSDAQARAADRKGGSGLKKARESPKPAPVIAAAEKRVEAAKAAAPGARGTHQG